ncbi:hypothetical protein BC567DRAFT_82112 [Phyllosticta citribraziliensis]
MRHEVMLCVLLIWHGIFSSRPRLIAFLAGTGSTAIVLRASKCRGRFGTRTASLRTDSSKSRGLRHASHRLSGLFLICQVTHALARCVDVIPSAHQFTWMDSETVKEIEGFAVA